MQTNLITTRSTQQTIKNSTKRFPNISVVQNTTVGPSSAPRVEKVDAKDVAYVSFFFQIRAVETEKSTQ